MDSAPSHEAVSDRHKQTLCEDVLVVIPTLNEAENIEKVLMSLQRDADAQRALIVVVDGGSRDGTLDIVARIAQSDPRITPLSSARPTPIQSASINYAVERYGRGKRWLVRVDAHADYPSQYISRLVSIAEQHDVESVVTPMTTDGITCFQKAAAAAQNSRIGTGGSPHRMAGQSGLVDHGHHALMSLAAYETAGGYDETFSHNEDAELDLRLAKHGGQIWLASELPLTYYPRKRAAALFQQYYRYGRGRARTVFRYKARLKLRQFLPLMVAPSCLLALAWPIAPVFALPALIWAIGSICYGLALGVGRDRCSLASGLCAMIMHLAWSLGYLRQRLDKTVCEAFDRQLAPVESWETPYAPSDAASDRFAALA